MIDSRQAALLATVTEARLKSVLLRADSIKKTPKQATKAYYRARAQKLSQQVQGLREKLKNRDAEIAALREQIDELKYERVGK